jgi:hypothetical protein
VRDRELPSLLIRQLRASLTRGRLHLRLLGVISLLLEVARVCRLLYHADVGIAMARSLSTFGREDTTISCPAQLIRSLRFHNIS